MRNRMQSSNPFTSRNYSHLERASAGEMTANGAANKAAVLIMIVFGGALFGWASSQGNTGMSGISIMAGIVGFILAMVTMFKPQIASITAPLYAGFEGLFLGGIAYMFELMYPGIATQAVIGTIGVFMVMMVLYRTGAIKVTEKMRAVVTALVMGVAVMYLLSFVIGLFTGVSVIGQGGTLGIVFSVFVIGVAAFSLLLDFDSIEKAELAGLPKYMEWFYALSLLITLVWLYIEILRLLSILRGND